MNLTGIFGLIGGIGAILGFVLWVIIGITALAITPNSSTYDSDPNSDYQKKLNHSNNVGNAARTCGWICLFSIIFLIMGLTIGYLVDRK